ncbi:hypothetical protein SALB1_1986 [Salinisphaera sp. LB1]|nr:hypothetical protein SALB1_1986 [Salinisphaera sp. LB1]
MAHALTAKDRDFHAAFLRYRHKLDVELCSATASNPAAWVKKR